MYKEFWYILGYTWTKNYVPELQLKIFEIQHYLTNYFNMKSKSYIRKSGLLKSKLENLHKLKTKLVL